MIIYKYVMQSRISEFQMPIGTKILSCQMQEMQGLLPSIWVMTYQEPALKKTRRFIGINTGEDIEYQENQLQFIATVQSGNYVKHIFEIVL